MRFLREQLPAADVRSDESNPVIIRIKSKRLQEIQGHSLERVTSVQYQGLLEGLPDAIGKAEKCALSTCRVVSSKMLYIDSTTKVDIEARRKPIRTILTDYLPLSDYNRVLWVAYTSMMDGKPDTEVWYLGGSLRSIRAPRYFPGTIASFFDGEDAFAWNPPSREAVQTALSFIRTQMELKEPRQVRWAMLFLAKSKAEDGVPVLLKHLDYKYTTCGRIEESFPAVKALREYGPRGRDAALEALARPESALRRRLLCHVLIAATGKEQAGLLLRRALESASEEAVRVNLRTALAEVEIASPRR
jgi:hypothetical protein